MGFFDGLIRGAQNIGGQAGRIGGDWLHNAANVQTPISSGAPGSQHVTLGDLYHSAVPAFQAGTQYGIKSGNDLINTLGGWSSSITGQHDAAQFYKDRAARTDPAIQNMGQQAQAQLGVKNNDPLLKAASGLTEVIKAAAPFGAGGKAAETLNGISKVLATSGADLKTLGTLTEIGKSDPQMGRMLTNAILHPETDVNLFKATLDGAKAVAGKIPGVQAAPLAKDSAIKLGQAGANMVGGTVGYATAAGALNNKSLGEVGKNIKTGLVGGNPIKAAQDSLKAGDKPADTGLKVMNELPIAPIAEFGLAGAGVAGKKALDYTAPKVGQFFDHALNSNLPQQTKAKLQQIADHIVGSHSEPAPVEAKPQEAPQPQAAPAPVKLSEINPAQIHAVQEHQAAQDMHVINTHNMLQAKQAENPNHSFQDLQGYMGARMEQLRAAKAQADQATQPQGGEDLSHSYTLVDGHLVKTGGESAPPATKMAPNETGSAHANQTGSDHPTQIGPEITAETKAAEAKAKQNRQNAARKELNPSQIKINEVVAGTKNTPGENAGIPKVEGKAASPTESAPPVVRRVYDENGNIKSMVHGETGQRVDVQHDGSPLHNFQNEVMNESKTNYGGEKRSGASVAAEHGSAQGGRQAVLNVRLKTALDDYNQRFNKEERVQISHFVEGTLKPEEVSAKVKQGAEQFKEMARLSHLVNKEGNISTGEINNGKDNYVPHINLKERPKPEDNSAPLGAGKYSVKNDQQQQRSVVKFTDKSGHSVIGTAESLGMVKNAEGKYVNKNGITYHASQATLAEKNAAGMDYETDSGKLLQHMMQNMAKTSNNLKLSKNLTTKDHGTDIIPRSPGEKTPPKGYVESHLTGMQGHWMSKAYHDHLYTKSDDTKGLLWKGAKNFGKYGLGLVNRPLQKAFFAENSAYHQIINETAQFVSVTSGGGSGKSKGIIKGLLGGPANAVKVSKELSSANKSVVNHDEKTLDFMRIGGRLSQDTSRGIPKAINGALNKIKDMGHSADVVGRFGHSMAIHIGDTIRLAKFNALTKDGMDPHAALHLVDELQGNNAKMGRFEKEIVSNYVAFYPFFKNMQVNGLKNITYGAIKNPGMYAGAASMAALTYGAYSAVNKVGQIAGGNPYFNIKKGGALGLADDIGKAYGQMQPKTDKAGVTHPGTLPSVISNRLNPVERLAAEQLTGKTLDKNQKFDTSLKGRLDEAGNSLAEYKQYKDLKDGKKSLAEIALNLNGVNMPHGQNTPALPNFNSGLMKPVGDLINVSGQNAKQTIDTANLVKTGGGDKLTAMQVLRLNGDHSLDKYFTNNPKLDPTSTSFQGFKNNGPQISKGDKAFKAAGGSSLTYMQALKMSGSTTYDKFFQAHPELDPTSNNFQGMKKSGGSKTAGSASIKYVKSQGARAVSRAKGLAHPVHLKTASGIRMPGKAMKTPHIKLATVKDLTPKTHTKLRLKA